MNNLAELINAGETRMDEAVVQRLEGSCLWLEDQGGLFPAKRAAGCLLTPEAGDLVLAVHLSSGKAFVLSVLERASTEAGRLEVEGDLEICTPNGALEISARDGLELGSATRASLAAPELEISAGEGKITMGSLTLLAGLISSQVDKMTLAARSVESVIGRLTQSLRNRFTKVEDLDRLEAATVSVEAEDLHSVRTRFSLLSVEEDAKIDAGIIHLG